MNAADIFNGILADFAAAQVAVAPKINDVIPMAFLIANSPPGATGPSDQTDTVQAIRDMVAAGRRVATRCAAAEERSAELEAHIKDFIRALDRGYLDCKDDSAFIDALRAAVA